MIEEKIMQLYSSTVSSLKSEEGRSRLKTTIELLNAKSLSFGPENSDDKDKVKPSQPFTSARQSLQEAYTYRRRIMIWMLTICVIFFTLSFLIFSLLLFPNLLSLDFTLRENIGIDIQVIVGSLTTLLGATFLVIYNGHFNALGKMEADIAFLGKMEESVRIVNSIDDLELQKQLIDKIIGTIK